MDFGAIHKRLLNILGGEGVSNSNVARYQKVEVRKSGSKFRHGGGGYQKRPKNSDVFYGQYS